MLLKGLNIRFEIEGGRVKELDEGAIEIIQCDEKKEKIVKKNESSLRGP